MPASGGRGGGFLALLVVGVTVVTLAFTLPILPCPSCRGPIYTERMRRAANAPPTHAAAIREYANADECRYCRYGRKTLIAYLGNSGGCLSWW